MEALFSSGVTALKLAYLISHALLGGNCIGNSCGFKTWEKIHGGCYISSPGYVMTTEEKKWIVQHNFLFWVLIAAIQPTGTQWQVTSFYTHFLSISSTFFTSHRKRDVHFVTLWDTYLGYCTGPCAHEQSQLRRGWINCHTDHSLSLFQISFKKRGGGVFWQETKFSFFFFEPPKIWAIFFMEFQNKMETFVLVHELPKGDAKSNSLLNR